MKKIIIVLSLLICLSANAQDYTRSGNQFISVQKEKSVAVEKETGYTWVDNKGIVYPIYISSTGLCYIKKVSGKTGKEYRMYLSKEISAQICKELGVEYKSK